MKFKETTTSSGKLVLAGKDAKSNEELIAQVEPNEDVFHTAKPGSPFVNIKKISNAKDRKEAAIFCARYSQDWRDNEGDVIVHHFKGKNIHKNKLMKLGTFGIRKKKVIKVKKKDIEKWENKKKKNN